MFSFEGPAKAGEGDCRAPPWTFGHGAFDAALDRLMMEPV
jgi:hypothetical protein